jgi:hypothetical protein
MNRQHRDRTPDELDRLEDEVVRHPDDRRDTGPDQESETGREPDRNHDGLPDNPAKYRVPS